MLTACLAASFQQQCQCYWSPSTLYKCLSSPSAGEKHVRTHLYTHHTYTVTLWFWVCCSEGPQMTPGFAMSMPCSPCQQLLCTAFHRQPCAAVMLLSLRSSELWLILFLEHTTAIFYKQTLPSEQKSRWYLCKQSASQFQINSNPLSWLFFSF